MIAIVNVGSAHNDEVPTERNYKVCINHRTVAMYTHDALDGLAVCLRRAANAVEVTRAKELAELCEAFSERNSDEHHTH